MNNLLWTIIIGIVAGFLAGKVVKGKGFGLIFNLLVGVGGAILGGWIFGQLGISIGTGLISTLITAFIGAIVLLFIINLLKKHNETLWDGHADPYFFIPKTKIIGNTIGVFLFFLIENQNYQKLKYFMLTKYECNTGSMEVFHSHGKLKACCAPRKYDDF